MGIIVKFAPPLICLLMLAGYGSGAEMDLQVAPVTMKKKSIDGPGDRTVCPHDTENQQIRLHRMGFGLTAAFPYVVPVILIYCLMRYRLASNPARRYGLTRSRIDYMAHELKTPIPVMECLYNNIARKHVPIEKSEAVLVGLADGYLALKSSLETDPGATPLKRIRQCTTQALKKGLIGRTRELLKEQQRYLAKAGRRHCDTGSKHAVREAVVLSELGHNAFLGLNYGHAAGRYQAAALKIDGTEHPDKLALRARYQVLEAIAHHANNKFARCGQAIEAALASYATSLLPDNPVYERLIIVGKRCIMLMDIDGANAIFEPILAYLMTAKDGRRADWLEIYLALADLYDANTGKGLSDRLRLKAIEILDPLGKDVEYLLFRTMFELAHGCLMDCRWDDALKYYSELERRLEDSPEEKCFFAEAVASNMEAAAECRKMDAMLEATPHSARNAQGEELES